MNKADSPYTIAEVATVIRAVSFALIIIPVMSLLRGYFQGHQSMGPSAVSQVIETNYSYCIFIFGAFFVLKILKGSMVLPLVQQHLQLLLEELQVLLHSYGTGEKESIILMNYLNMIKENADILNFYV